MTPEVAGEDGAEYVQKRTDAPAEVEDRETRGALIAEILRLEEEQELTRESGQKGEDGLLLKDRGGAGRG